MLIETLQQYGLSEKESKVYLAGLTLGSAPGSTIARHAGENRVTVYSILKELVKKGIFTSLERQGIAYFSPISPEILVRNLEDKYTTIKEKLPEFLALVDKSNNKPKVQFFEGLEGVKKLFEDFSTTSVNMETIIGTPDRHNDILLPISATYRKKRKEKGLIAKRIITGQDKIIKKEKNEDKLFGRNTIIIKENPFNISADINIYGPGKVSFLFFDENSNTPYAVVISSETLYSTMHGLFEYIWKINGGK